MICATLLLMKWKSLLLTQRNVEFGLQKVSPAPSPGLGSGGAKGPGNEADPSSREGCLVSSEACHVNDLSACLLYAGNGNETSFLLFCIAMRCSFQR